jgi:transcription elongation factor SPT5
VEDTDEDEDIEEDDIPDDGHPDDEQDLAIGGELDDRRHRQLDQARRRADDVDAEEQARIYADKYGRQKRVQDDAAAIPQHLLLPSVEDPSIWAIKCKMGKENEVVNTIMKRFAERMDTPESLNIISCFARAGGPMAGYIYIEARRQIPVVKATENVPFCYSNSGISLIDLAEMPDLLKVRPPKEIKVGSYVRIKRPVLYANDLGMVVDVDATASEVTVRLVPRLEPPEEENGGAAKRKRPGVSNYRPPAKLANMNEVKQKFGRYFQPISKTTFRIRQDEYENGFLVKTVKFTAIETENVNPTLEEASRFASSTEQGEAQELDLQALAATIKNSSLMDDFLPGDMVEIFQGEQTGVKGKTLSVHSEIVTLLVSEGVLRGQRIEAPTKTLRKLFREGDAVKVLANSKYHGESGMVVKVFQDKVTLLADSNKAEITVFSRDLRVAQDGGAPVGLSKYDLFDIVQLDAATVGCVVKVDRETVGILDQNGTIRTVLPSSITDKLDKRRLAIATDRDGSEIHVGDVVKEYSGMQRSGEVKYIHRTFLFLHARDTLENAGMFVARGQGVNVSSAKNARQIETPDLNKLNPALRNGAGGTGNMAPPPKNMMRDRIDGKEVMVVKGPFRGLKGLVKDTTALNVRVEFHTKAGLTIFTRDQLHLKDQNNDTYHPIGERPGARRPGGPPGAGNGMGSRVPMGARTPMGAGFGSGGGGRTPAWSGGEGRTPAWSGGAGAEGGKTPAWRQGEGGRTPAWANSSSSRTPAWAPDGGRTAYGGDGSRTAYGGGVSIPPPVFVI